MRRFACWQEKEISRTIVDDANRDAPAVFSAVHRPARILRKDIRRAALDPGTPATEQDVLSALVGGDPAEDRIVPIVGESGTGKSHLIRWLDAHIERRSDRHVVYIEKRGTSLRQVIHEILKGLEGPDVRHRDRFIQLREEVDKAAAGLDSDTAGLRLLSALALEIREHGAEGASGEADREDREDLATGLYDLLTDREFREPLLADGGVIAATVDKALGKGVSDGEAPAFTELRLEISDVMRAGAVARELRQDLYGDPDLLALAIRMLNEQLNPALGALIGVDRKQVYEVMLDVREALRDEGKTLVLLVEDFALLRGVETQLLDAMIADQQSRGEDVLCPMRSALAVTSGYFEGKETALTRVHSRGRYIYSLDAPLGESEIAVPPEDVHAFVATYLNAARVGRAGLTERFEQRRLSDGERDWVPNACHACEFEARCHPAFGTADGYGLYPFNAETLNRIVGSQTDKFDPRHILQIVEEALRTQRKTLVEGGFPDPSWCEQYDQQRVPRRPDLPYLPASVATTYEEFDPGTAERRKALATFWGGVPQRAVNLDPTIHEAFDLNLLPELPQLEALGEDKEEEEEKKGDVTTPVRDPASRREPEPRDTVQERDNRALDAWARRQVLEQDLANRIRRSLATAVRGAREWSCFGVDPKNLERVVNNQAFSLGSNAKGEGSAASNPIGVLEPSDTNAFLLQGVLEAERKGNWAFDRGLERMATFADLVDRWADEALTRLRRPELVSTSPETAAIVQLLMIGSAVLGFAGPDDSDERLLESAFESVGVGAGDQWGMFQRRLMDGPSGAASRADLVSMLLARASLRRAMDAANVVAIDAGPIVQAITELRKAEWAIPSAEDLEKADRSIRQHADALRRDLVEEVEKRLAELATSRKRALDSLGATRDPGKMISGVMSAYGVASDAGVGVSVGGADRAEIEARFRQADLTVLHRLDRLDRVNGLEWPEKLALLVASAKEELRPIDEYLSWAEELLDGSIRDVDAALGGGDGDGDGAAKTTAELVDILRDVARELESEVR